MNKFLARTQSKIAPVPVPAGLAATSPALPPIPPNGHAAARGGEHHQSRSRTPVDNSPAAGCRRCDYGELERLYAALEHITPERSPRTFKLTQSSKRKISQKVIEEAGEVALEAVKYHAGGVIRESADLLYHLVVLWHRSGVDPSEVWSEMRTRANVFGIAEKLPRPSAGTLPPPTRTVHPQTAEGVAR